MIILRHASYLECRFVYVLQI